MPTTKTVFEREIRDISLAALKLEKFVAASDSNPSPVKYQQILKRVSELHQMWRAHTRNGFHIEQQLKAISISTWPRSADAGIASIRLSVTRILKLLFQHIALERSTSRPATMDAEFHIRSLADHRMNHKYRSVSGRQ